MSKQKHRHKVDNKTFLSALADVKTAGLRVYSEVKTCEKYFKRNLNVSQVTPPKDWGNMNA